MLFRNKYRHPLVIPIACESESESESELQQNEEVKNISKDKDDIGPVNNSNNLNDSYLENSINSESKLRIVVEMKKLAEEN